MKPKQISTAGRLAHGADASTEVRRTGYGRGRLGITDDSGGLPAGGNATSFSGNESPADASFTTADQMPAPAQTPAPAQPQMPAQPYRSTKARVISQQVAAGKTDWVAYVRQRPRLIVKLGGAVVVVLLAVVVLTPRGGNTPQHAEANAPAVVATPAPAQPAPTPANVTQPPARPAATVNRPAASGNTTTVRPPFGGNSGEADTGNPGAGTMSTGTSSGTATSQPAATVLSSPGTNEFVKSHLAPTASVQAKPPTVAPPTPTTTSAPATAGPAAQTQPVKFRDPPSGMRLTGIMRGPKGPLACVNNRYLAVGGTIARATVVEIRDFSIVMELGGERFMLGISTDAPQKAIDDDEAAPPDSESTDDSATDDSSADKPKDTKRSNGTAKKPPAKKTTKSKSQPADAE